METKDSVVYKMFMETMPREKRRKFTNFMKNHQPITRQEIARQEITFKEYYGNNEPFKEVKEFYTTLEKHISSEFIFEVWSNTYKRTNRKQVSYNKMPKPDGRDNKVLYVGSGGSNRHSIRWPKKVRGKATWNNFWKLFPSTKGFKSEKEMQNYRLEQERKIKQQEELENE